MIILEIKKKKRNILNWVFHLNFLLNDGMHILKESASNLGQPASCPILVETRAAVPPIKNKVPPSLPQRVENKFDSWNATCGPSGAISRGPSIPAPAIRKPDVTSIPIIIAKEES